MHSPSPTLAILLSFTLAACQSAGRRELDPALEARSRNLGSPWTGERGTAGWVYDAVLGFESEPDYAGSDDNVTEADALVRALYEDRAGHRYFVSPGEVGAWWKLGQDWALGTVFEFEEGRDPDNPALVGLAEQEDTVEGQITIARRFGDFTIAGVLQPDVLDRGKGFVTFAALGYDRMLGDSLRIYSALDISFGDAEHMGTEFGIRGSETAASSLSAYDPSGGLKSSTFDLGIEVLLSDSWSLLIGGSTEYYFSIASDSPLIADEGSDLVYEGGIGLRYSR